MEENHQYQSEIIHRNKNTRQLSANIYCAIRHSLFWIHKRTDAYNFLHKHRHSFAIHHSHPHTYPLIHTHTKTFLFSPNSYQHEIGRWSCSRGMVLEFCAVRECARNCHATACTRASWPLSCQSCWVHQSGPVPSCGVCELAWKKDKGIKKACTRTE